MKNGVSYDGGEAEYTQDGDSCSDEDIQVLTVKTYDAGGGRYWVISTDRWAFDSLEEFLDILLDAASKLELPETKE